MVDNVRGALARILSSFAKQYPSGEHTHESAVVAPDIIRGAGVWIGPGVIVGNLPAAAC